MTCPKCGGKLKMQTVTQWTPNGDIRIVVWVCVRCHYRS